MFDGVMRRPRTERADGERLPSRFISDAETFEHVTVYALDTGSMLVVELATALILARPVRNLGDRRRRAATRHHVARDAAHAGTGRQRRTPPGRTRRADRDADPRACQRRPAGTWSFCDRGRAPAPGGGSPGLGASRESAHLRGARKARPIAVVVAAAFARSYHAGTLLTLYLLAARASTASTASSVSVSACNPSAKPSTAASISWATVPGRSRRGIDWGKPPSAPASRTLVTTVASAPP